MFGGVGQMSWETWLALLIGIFTAALCFIFISSVLRQHWLVFCSQGWGGRLGVTGSLTTLTWDVFRAGRCHSTDDANAHSTEKTALVCPLQMSGGKVSLLNGFFVKLVFFICKSLGIFKFNFIVGSSVPCSWGHLYRELLSGRLISETCFIPYELLADELTGC